MSSYVINDMSRVSSILLVALLLFCSPAAAFGVGSQPASSTQPSANNPAKPPGFNETSSHLSLGTPERSETYTSSLSLSTTLEMDRNKVQSQQKMYTLDEKLSNADDDEERYQLLTRFRTDLELELSSLKNKERSASKQFNNQEIGVREYVERLAMLDSRADDVNRAIDHMKTKGKSVIQFAPHEYELRADLIPLRGEVRNNVVESVRSGTGSKYVYVATTSDGTVLSTVLGNKYVREAYRSDYRNSSLDSYLTGREKTNITVNSYPWVKEKNPGTSSNIQYKKGVSETKMVYPQGVITAYLDSGTEKIYREIQYKLLTGDNHTPYGTAIRNNSTDLHLAVNRTYPGGPLRINLTDANGDPVQSTIEIGENEVGETDSDGILLTVSPRRTFTVSARHGSERVNVTVTPYGVTRTNATNGPPQDIAG
ncbi:DUF7096 domain-containing protein [Haladaptatus paucihalophilus]|uniref:Uncharacterized protein n=2 Tax=Haladaptatus paucihalophilus DX253 TaxID=797209 RepID=A0A1M7AVB5_HALPU|nr:hypothetical protein SAMN05444342_3872 [Haladaptatus paucihalophilus DX253]